ncbi:MAG: GSCFA domain-containing protein [Spirochaetaceae bacterium]|nr:GSCFA domain-containing protein [Spirochaetaceae bacterium]
MTPSPWQQSYSPVLFPESGLQLKPQQKFLLAGSCFAQELSTYLKNHFMDRRFSPQGIAYNPLSLSEGLDLLVNPESLSSSGLILQDQRWKHYQFHGERYAENPDDFLVDAQRDLEECIQWMGSSPLLVLTLGTSWVYRLKDSGALVNNCHRVPSDQFYREIVNIRTMKNRLLQSLENFKNRFPGLRVVLSVSPVRHLRDDPRQNSLSKARLICTAQELAEDKTWINYFPSYEIVMDELRDYRWYAQDLKHLAPQAVYYIMERFMDWAAHGELTTWLSKAKKMKARLNHRIENHDDQNRAFIHKTREMLEGLQGEYPHFKALYPQIEESIL